MDGTPERMAVTHEGDPGVADAPMHRAQEGGALRGGTSLSPGSDLREVSGTKEEPRCRSHTLTT